MKNLLLIGFLCFGAIYLESCSLKAPTDSPPGTSGGVQKDLKDLYTEAEKVDPTLDSDGDGLTDVEEISKGKNPFLANLPEFKVRFLQNYKIEGSYEDLSKAVTSQQILIDTKLASTDPDFKYRVGRIFARDNAYNVAASQGRFSSHNEGEIHEHDYTWVKYPDIDPKFFHQKALELAPAFKETSSFPEFKITLENSFQLLPNRGFDTISNLEVSYYYYNYERESYELLSTQKVERHFNAGVTETFETILLNVPEKLLEENYLKKGEFIISEVTDFEIPSLGTTYKKLLSSVKAKTIHVAINTPLESSVYYVSTGPKGRSFNEVLRILYDKAFKVEEDKLTKVGQFENNLPDYTYLKELEDKDKLGKWFVFSNKLNQSFLDHRFIKGDYLTLSYITGTELANQSEEKIYSRKESFDGGDESIVTPLGNINPNSKVSLVIKGLYSSGTILDRKQEVIDTQDRSCGKNCFSVGRFCRWDIVTPLHYSVPATFKDDFTGDIEKLSIVINDTEYSLKDLFNVEDGKRKISLKFEKDILYVEIPDITKIAPLKNSEENVLFFKVKTTTQNSFYGIKLSEVGRAWDGVGGCPFLTPGMSLDKGLPIARESIQFDKIEYARKNALRPEFQGRVTYSQAQAFKDRLSVSISSRINNFFN